MQLVGGVDEEPLWWEEREPPRLHTSSHKVTKRRHFDSGSSCTNAGPLWQDQRACGHDKKKTYLHAKHGRKLVTPLRVVRKRTSWGAMWEEHKTRLSKRPWPNLPVYLFCVSLKLLSHTMSW